MNSFSQWLEKQTVWLPTTLLTLLSSALAKSAHELIMLPLLSANKGERVALIASLSTGLFLFFLSYSIYLQFFKNTKKSKKYLFNETTGTYSHKKTGKLFCASCLIKNIESPLKTLPYGWICINKECNLYYNDPSNQEPEQQPAAISSYIASSRRRMW